MTFKKPEQKNIFTHYVIFAVHSQNCTFTKLCRYEDVCKTEYETVYDTVTEEKCETQYETEYTTEFDTACDTVYEQKCEVGSVCIYIYNILYSYHT